MNTELPHRPYPQGRSLRGNVDRNLYRPIRITHAIMVVPYVGPWIEIFQGAPANANPIVVPYVGTWIEMLQSPTRLLLTRVVPYVGTWIEILKSEFR